MSPRLLSRRATSRSASSRFRYPPSAPSSGEPVQPAQRRSSTRRPRSKRNTSCSTSSIFSSSTKANSASWHRRSEEHTSELQSQSNLVCRLLLEKKKQKMDTAPYAENYVRAHVTCDNYTR